LLGRTGQLAVRAVFEQLRTVIPVDVSTQEIAAVGPLFVAVQLYVVPSSVTLNVAENVGGAADAVAAEIASASAATTIVRNNFISTPSPFEPTSQVVDATR
jgi:hypothetical protein